MPNNIQLLLVASLASLLWGGCAAAIDGPQQDLVESTGSEDTEATLPLQMRVSPLGIVDPLDQELLEAARDRVLADVRARQSGQHGELPPVARSEALTPDAWPVISVRNDTPHGLVVWLAGPCPRTLALPPRGEAADQLCEGEYDIAAELASDNYLPFVGESNSVESGYRYTLTFYVVAAPRRHRLRTRGSQ